MEHMPYDLMWKFFYMTEPMEIIKKLTLVNKKWLLIATCPIFWAKNRVDRFGEIDQLENIYNNTSMIINQKFIVNSISTLTTLSDSDQMAWAIKNCCFALLKRLIANGCVLTNKYFYRQTYHDETCDIGFDERYIGLTPIHYAVKFGKIQIVNLLIDHGYAIEIVKDGIHPIHYATALGHIQIIQLFLQKDIDINIKNNLGDSAIRLACKSQNLNIVKFLCEHGANVLEDINYCIFYGGLEIAKYLILKYGAVDMNNDISDLAGGKILHCCLMKQDIEMINFVINQGADINGRNIRGDPPIFYAIFGIDTIKYFIEKYHIDPCVIANGYNILFHIIFISGRQININVFEYLLNNFQFDLEMQFGGLTILNLVIYKNRLDMAKLLIDAGANIINLNGNNFVPLHLACVIGNLDFVKLLINAGAELNETILLSIYNYNQSNIMNYLLDNHASKFPQTLPASMFSVEKKTNN